MKCIRATVATLVAAVVVGMSPAMAAPLCGPQIKDMVFLAEGPSNCHNAVGLLKRGNYVYVSGERGMLTVDVTNPAAMILRSDHTNTGPHTNGLATKDNALYLANWVRAEGLVVFNLSNPAAPSYVETYPTPSWTFAISVFGNYLYVGMAGAGEPIDGVDTYDITNATSPSFVGHLASAGIGVARSGDYLYVPVSGGLDIYNVTNPASPQYVRYKTFDSTGFKAAVRGRCLYVLAHYGNKPGLYVYSLASPSNPQKTSNWGEADLYEATDMCLIGNYCVVTASGSGCYTLDVSDPTNTTNACGPWWVRWPDSLDGGVRDGYAICVTGEGNYAYIGTAIPGNADPTSPYFGARLYSVRISDDPSMPTLQEVDIDLGSSDRTNGLTLVSNADGDTTPATVGGRDCRGNTNPANDFYFHFGVAGSFAFEGNNPDVYITVDYYDAGSASLQLQYDSSTGSGTAVKYRSGGSVTLTATNTWRQHTFHVMDAYFGDRENNGADFRIFGGVGNAFYLDRVRVSVLAPPAAVLAADPASGLAPLTVSLTGSGSSDPDGTIVSYRWDFGDGQHGTGVTATHVYAAPGAFAAVLTVTDNDGLTGAVTVMVTCSFLRGDFDGDRDADLTDFSLFQLCFGGPNRPVRAECAARDLDSDGDVDPTDFAAFQQCFNGPNQPPACPQEGRPA